MGIILIHAIVIIHRNKGNFLLDFLTKTLVYANFLTEAVARRCYVKKCSSKFRKIDRKTLFLLKKRLQHRCFLENFAKYLETSFL